MTQQKRIPVFFNPKQVANSKAFSPSAAKPGPVVDSWLQMRLPIDVHESGKVNRYELARAHDPEFVANVLSCRIPNGFGNMDPKVAASLPYTSGSLLAAAQHAWREGGVAASPTSGFHHAGYDSVNGFCTFNGLMVTAQALLACGANKIGILDLDMHYGNGTDNIVNTLGLDDKIEHFTGGRDYHNPDQAPEFFKKLPSIMRKFDDCDVVLYQAGADSNVKDPLGGWLTNEEQYKRDYRVFKALSRMQVPCAWNLAGGYQKEEDGSIPKVLAIHNNTMTACHRVYVRGE